MDATSRTLRLALAASVGLNLFCMGVLARWWSESPRHAPTPASPVAHLPPPPLEARRGERRDRGRPARNKPRHRWLSREQRAQLRPSREALRSARRSARDALTTQPLNMPQLQRALLELREQSSKTQQALHDLVLREAPEHSPEERRELVRLVGGQNRPDRADRDRRPRRPKASRPSPPTP